MQSSNEAKETASYGLILADGPTVPLPGGTDIIFVHGLGSWPATTWMSKSGTVEEYNNNRWFFQEPLGPDVCWVTGFLPEDLKERGRKKDRIFFYNYDSQWSQNAVVAGLDDFAHQMLHKINLMRDTVEARRRQLLFVAHSYGGLVVKKALVQANSEPRYKEIVGLTTGVIFLGTPHRGSNIATGGMFVVLMKWLFYDADMQLLLPLRPESAALLKLDKHFYKILRTSNMLATSFSEQKKVSLETGWFSLPYRFLVVSKESSKLRVPRERKKFVVNLQLNLNHFELNKYGEKTDPGYQDIRKEILKMLNLSKDRVCMIPHGRIQTYTERKDLSRQLDQIFISPGSSSCRMNAAVLHGFGGTGKTQIVLDFIQRHQQKFNPILWIDATNAETIRSSFGNCVRVLGLETRSRLQQPLEPNSFPALVETLSFLRERGGEDTQWLMVVDNADDEGKEYIESIMPDTQFGNVVVIGQHAHLQSLSNEYPRIECHLLSHIEARTMLMSPLVGSLDHNSYERAIPLADDLVKRAGHIALAVDFLAAFILQEELNGHPTDSDATLETVLQKSLEDMEIHLTEMLSWPSNHSPYQKSILQIWARTMKAIYRRYPDYVGEFFYFMTAFDTTSIEEGLFANASLAIHHLRQQNMLVDEWVPRWLLSMITTWPTRKRWDKFNFERASKVLARYHLVTIDTSAGQTRVSIHKLVASQAKQTMLQRHGADGYRYLLFFASIVRTLMQKGEASADDESLHICARHLGYAMPIVTAGRPTAGISLAETHLWLLLAELPQAMERWDAVQIILGDMTRLWKDILPPDDEQMLKARQTLAICYDRSGEHDKAIMVLKEVCTIKQDTLGPADPSTLESLLALADVYYYKGKLKRAFMLSMHVYEHVEAVYGLLDDQMSDVLLHVLRPAIALGWIEVAKEVVEAGHNVAVLKHGKDHPAAMQFLRVRARIHLIEGELDEAKQLYTHRLDTYRRTRAPDHTLVIFALEDLANFYDKIDDEPAAYALREEIDSLSDSKLKRFGWTDDIIKSTTEHVRSEQLRILDKMQS